MHEALLYDKLTAKAVACRLCNHYCRIEDTAYGICGVRQNISGTLYSRVWGRPIAQAVDPIEKKPLNHFLPATESFSLATVGCNFRCGFCQNWQISQAGFKDVFGLPQDEVAPEEIVEKALKNNCRSISYTYTEPTIFLEYALDIAKVARKKGLKNIFVTNGYMTKEAVKMMRPYVDAANVDLKFFRQETYAKICRGKLQPVKESIRTMHKLGIWLEITTLLVTGELDPEEELSGIAGFIAGLDKFIPWHLSCFYPNYNFTRHQPTPEPLLKKAAEIAKNAGLRYIYVGNVYGWGNNTCCHNCQKLLIQREGFAVLENNIAGGKCKFCKTLIPGVFV